MSATPLTDLFIDTEPFYLSIGMTHEQFWEGDTWMTRVYREADLLNRERQNEMAYLHGLYNYQGFGAVIANFAMGFSKRKTKPKEYLKEPIRITPLSEREERTQQKKAEMIIRNRLARFSRRR